MLIKTPTKFYMTNGDSEGFTALNAFDGALLKAGIGNTNLLRMSSICPPRAQQIFAITLPQGSLVPVAYASITSMIPGDIISAGIAIAFPEEEDQAGLIMEYSAKEGRKQVQDMVSRMAEEGMMMRGKKIREIKSSAVEHKVGTCGCAFAAVVLWD